jgi:melibiose permease
MIPALTEPGRGRENLSVIARSAAGFGFALPVGLTMVLVPLLGGGSERAGFSRVALIVAVVFVIGILITTIQVKEKNPAAGKSPRVRDLFRALVKNDQALVVVVSIVVFNASLYLTNQLALYFFRFDIGNAALFGVFGTVGGAAQILAMLTIPLLRKKFSSKSILVGGILTTMTGYALLFVMGSLSITNMALLSVAAIIIFMGFGIATVLTTVFLANTVDYGEWKNGQRTESVIFSLQTFVVKLASAFSVLIAGVGLDLVGLDVDAAVQTDATLLGLRFLMVVVPMIGLAFAIIYFVRFYKLGDDQLTEITGELANRRES